MSTDYAYLVFPAVFLSAVLLGVFVQSRDRRGLLNEIAKAVGGKVSSGNIVTVQAGRVYRLRYTEKMQQDTPARLTVIVAARSPGAFEITEETAEDQRYKKLGVAAEIQTGDAAFDDDFYIRTHTPGYTRKFFEAEENRLGVCEVFRQGFTSLRHDGGVLSAGMWLTDYDFEGVGKERSLADLRERLMPAFAALEILVRNLRATPLAGLPERSHRRTITRFCVFLVPVLVWLAPALLVPTGPSPAGAALMAYIAAGIYIAIAAFLLRGPAFSRVEFALVCFLTIPLFRESVPVLAAWANSRLDRGTPRVVESPRAAAPEPSQHPAPHTSVSPAADAESIDALKRAIESNPRDFDAYLKLDRVLTRLRSWDELIAYWNRYIEIVPDNAEAYLERSGTYQWKGDPASALSDLDKACGLGHQRACEIRRSRYGQQ